MVLDVSSLHRGIAKEVIDEYIALKEQHKAVISVVDDISARLKLMEQDNPGISTDVEVLVSDGSWAHNGAEKVESHPFMTRKLNSKDLQEARRNAKGIVDSSSLGMFVEGFASLEPIPDDPIYNQEDKGLYV